MGYLWADLLYSWILSDATDVIRNKAAPGLPRPLPVYVLNPHWPLDGDTREFWLSRGDGQVVIA